MNSLSTGHTQSFHDPCQFSCRRVISTARRPPDMVSSRLTTKHILSCFLQIETFPPARSHPSACERRPVNSQPSEKFSLQKQRCTRHGKEEMSVCVKAGRCTHRHKDGNRICLPGFVKFSAYILVMSKTAEQA